MSTNKEHIFSPKINLFRHVSAFYLFTQQKTYLLNLYLTYILNTY